MTFVSRSLLLIVAAVGVSHWWMLDAPFVLDDYAQLVQATAWDRGDFLLGGNRETSTIFRPVVHLTQRLDWELWGIDRVGDHLSSIAYHLVACLALFLVVRELLPRRHLVAALAAALIFAVHPAKHEAIVWLAARTSLLPGMFGALAALALVRFRRGSNIGGALVFPLLAGAFLSKESAVGFGGALAALDVLLLHRGVRRPWGYTLGLAAFPGLLWGTRLAMFGGDAMRYLGWHARVEGDTITGALVHLPRMAVEFFGGTASLTPGGGGWPTVAAVALLVAGIAATPAASWTWRGAGALLAAFVCVALPTAFAVQWGYAPEPGSATFVSRFSYAAGTVLCIGLAVPCASLGAGGARRWIAVTYTLGLAAWIGAASYAEYERFGSRVSIERHFLDDVAAAVSAAPDTAVAVDGLPRWMTGMTWHGIGPPFHEREVALVPFPSDEASVRKLARSPRPVQLASWDEVTGRVVFDGPPSPAPAGVPPTAVAADPPAASIEFGGVPARDALVLALELVVPVDVALFDIVLTDEDGRELRIESGRHAMFSEAPAMLVAVEDYLGLLRLGRLARVSVDSVDGVLIRRVEARRELPRIELVDPPDGAVVILDAAAAFVIRDPRPHPAYRVGMTVGLHEFHLVVPRVACREREDGAIAIPFTVGDLRGGIPPLAETLRHVGLDRLVVDWWVDGLDGNVFQRQTRSGKRRVTFVR